MTKITAITWRGVADPRLKSADELTWDDLPDWLALIAEGVESKENAKCYSLVTLVDADAGRRRTNIALVHAISLDFDSSAPPWDVLAEYEYVAYTTPSHTVAAPRWRVHMPLMNPVKPDVYRRAAEGLIAHMDLDVDHAASCDAARLWFSPLETSDLKVNSGAPVPGGFAQFLPPGTGAPRAAAAPAALEAAWPVEAVAELVSQQWTDGVKHNTARALGGYLARRGWDDDSIMSVIEAQPSDATAKRVAYALGAAERARTDLSAPGWGELQQMFGDVWCQSLASAARHPDEPADWHLSGQPWSAWWARNAARLESALDTARAAARDAKTDCPLLVGYGQDWWLRDDASGSGGYHDAVPRVNLKVRLANAGVDTRDKGKRLSLDEITEDWGVLAAGVEHRFAAGGVTWDAERQFIIKGYSLPAVEPVRDADVETWLRALFGRGYDEAMVWIAACAPRWVETQLTACMVLIGAHGTGKSLLFHALAKLWGAPAPVKLKHACERFNASILECPIVLDDEASWMQQGEMSAQDFLERIQERERLVEPKGREKQLLVGCQRAAITANDAGSIRLRKVKGTDTVDAAVERFAWHQDVRADAARKALVKLYTDGGGFFADVDRIVRHLRWVWDTVEVKPTSRFLGGRGAAEARSAVTGDAVDRYGSVYDLLWEQWLKGEGTHLAGSVVVKTSDGTLLASATALAGRLELSLEEWQVREAFKMVTVLPSRSVKVGGKVRRMFEISASELERLVTACVTEKAE